MRNEHSKANEELLAKSLQSPASGTGERLTVWINKTSEGARKAWEVRRANGEGAAKPKDEPKADAKAEAKPSPKSTKAPELKLNPAHLSGVKGGSAKQAFENAKSRILAAGFRESNHQQVNVGEWANNHHEFVHDDGRKIAVDMDYGPTKNDNRMQVKIVQGAQPPALISNREGTAMRPNPAVAAPKAEDTAVAHHRQLVHILTQEDVKRQKREPNIHRLSLFFEALDRAKAHPQGLAAGLRESFEDSPLRNRMLRVVEGKAAKDAEDIITDLVAKDRPSIEALISQHTEKADSDEVQACVRRKIPIIADDHPEMENEQRVAIAFSMCRKDPGVA